MDKFLNILDKWNIDIDEHLLELFERYYEILVEWNDNINLTAIVDKEDVYIKHFADSLAVLSYTDMSNMSVMDVGSGAGFPGIPIGIMVSSCNVLLLDSLNKRIGFLNNVIHELDLNNIGTIHGRAEDFGRINEYRESFDRVTSRAVANLSVLSEYCLPFVKTGGYFISYKSGNIDEEIATADHAIRSLGGYIEKIEKYCIPETDYERSLIFIRKDNNTDGKYPRKAGVPNRKPL